MRKERKIIIEKRLKETTTNKKTNISLPNQLKRLNELIFIIQSFKPAGEDYSFYPAI